MMEISSMDPPRRAVATERYQFRHAARSDFPGVVSRNWLTAHRPGRIDHRAMEHTDYVGWAASVLLFITLSWQVRQQWRSGSVSGVSPFLFTGQVLSSALFVIYSALLANWVFVVSNVFILVLAVVGQLVYLRNSRRRRAEPQ
jgi:uncharacterized protein with PQ loop repeat